LAAAVPVVVLVPSDEVKLPTAAVAEVRNEVASACRLLSALLALEYRLLSSLERLLLTEGSAVAATEEMLEATEAADASRDDIAPARDDVMELNSEGKAVASDDATDAMSDPAAPATDVTSPATELTIDPKSWALALSAKAAKTRGLVKCILKDDGIAGFAEAAV
jgi:hypothetical protein